MPEPCDPHLYNWLSFTLHPNGYVSHAVRCERCGKVKHRQGMGDMPTRDRLSLAIQRLGQGFVLRGPRAGEAQRFYASYPTLRKYARILPSAHAREEPPSAECTQG